MVLSLWQISVEVTRLRKIIIIFVISLLRSSCNHLDTIDIAIRHAVSFRSGKRMLGYLVKLIFVDVKEFSFGILDMILALILFFRLEMEPMI